MLITRLGCLLKHSCVCKSKLELYKSAKLPLYSLHPIQLAGEKNIYYSWNSSSLSGPGGNDGSRGIVKFKNLRNFALESLKEQLILP
jgi:hypothetical protein